MAFATCFIKGSIADTITQTKLEQPKSNVNTEDTPNTFSPNYNLAVCRVHNDSSVLNMFGNINKTLSSLDWLRNCRFAIYSGLYGGCVQHFIYNVLYPIIIPGTTFRFVLLKSFIDATIHAPLCYFPFYYAMKSLFLGESPINGIKNYWYNEKWTVLTAYWKVWCPVMICVFWFVPFELRVATVGAVSLIWLVILSYLAPMKDIDEKQQIDHKMSNNDANNINNNNTTNNNMGRNDFIRHTQESGLETFGEVGKLSGQP